MRFVHKLTKTSSMYSYVKSVRVHNVRVIAQPVRVPPYCRFKNAGARYNVGEIAWYRSDQLSQFDWVRFPLQCRCIGVAHTGIIEELLSNSTALLSAVLEPTICEERGAANILYDTGYISILSDLQYNSNTCR